MRHRSGSKVGTLAGAIATIPDGSVVALGGNTVHRSPSAAVRELARQGKRGLTVVKTAGGYDVDLLCAAGCVARLIVAYVGFENLEGLAPGFRAAVEAGRVAVEEQTCPTVIAGLRAAAQGIPFMPIAGMSGSDLVPGRFLAVRDPYSGGEVVTVPALRPDWAIVHAQESDQAGNARVHGTQFEDLLMCRAAERVLVTCERFIDEAETAAHPELTAIPGFQVEAVVEAPHGAWPASCAGYYDVDEAYLTAYAAAARKNAPGWLARFIGEPSASGQPAVVPAGWG